MLIDPLLDFDFAMESELGRTIDSFGTSKVDFLFGDLATFTLEGEACGPRTELWTAYLEGEAVSNKQADLSKPYDISFVSGFNVWLRCSSHEWKADETFLIIIYKRVGGENAPWTNESCVHHFSKDFRLSPTETKNTSYVIEVATMSGQSVARSPILRGFTERWFREKLKKGNILPLKGLQIGRYASGSLLDFNHIDELSGVDGSQHC
eukprot:TRINITY_DN8325_c0_g1_i4.p1 TRINITY_DN8325_c0_g1~~TRINITY_DN8325_c0_g1_i4.p1  ORF type:complete len:208 (+),score=21.65 TRINITY_DN8325_c0_g1_i4:1209-1832(+)